MLLSTNSVACTGFCWGSLECASFSFGAISACNVHAYPVKLVCTLDYVLNGWLFRSVNQPDKWPSCKNKDCNQTILQCFFQECLCALQSDQSSKEINKIPFHPQALYWRKKAQNPKEKRMVFQDKKNVFRNRLNRSTLSSSSSSSNLLLIHTESYRYRIASVSAINSIDSSELKLLPSQRAFIRSI